MPTRSELTRQWWRRLRRRFPRRPLGNENNRNSPRLRPRGSQLEALERRELMAYDPLMYTVPDSPWNSWELDTYSTTTETTPLMWEFSATSPTTTATTAPATTYPVGAEPAEWQAETSETSELTTLGATWLSGTSGWGIRELRLQNDTGYSDTDRVTWDATLIGRLAPMNSNTLTNSDNVDNSDQSDVPNAEPPNAAGIGAPHIALEWDHSGNGEVAARTWIERDGTFSYLPEGLEYGQRTIRFRVLEWDFDGSGPSRGAWHSFSFTYMAAPAPQIAALQFVDQRHDPNGEPRSGHFLQDFFPSDVTGVILQGVVQDHLGTPIPFAPVYLDLSGNGSSDALITAGEDGRFRYLLEAQNPGNEVVHVRSSRWDAVARADVHGNWNVATQELMPQQPPDMEQVDRELDEQLPRTEPYQSYFADHQLMVNGDPAIHREFQRQIQVAEQQYHDHRRSSANQVTLSHELLEYRQQLHDAWREYQTVIQTITARRHSEQLDALGMLSIRATEAEQAYYDTVTSPPPLGSTGTLSMEEAYAQYSAYLRQLEEQGQERRADILAEARREFLDRNAAAQRIYTEELAKAWKTWRLVQITAERGIAELESDWLRENRIQEVLAWKNLQGAKAAAVLAAAQAQAEHRLDSLQRDDRADGELTLAEGEQEKHLQVATETHRVVSGAIQLEAAYALTNILVRHGTTQAHLAARFDSERASILAEESLHRGLAAVRYEADIDRAEAEFEFLRSSLPLEAAQLQGIDPTRESLLAGLRRQWNVDQAEIERHETHRRTQAYQTWSQVDLQAQREYHLAVNRIEQVRSDQLSQHDGRKSTELADLDAAYFQTRVAAGGQLAQVQSAVAAARRIAEAQRTGDSHVAALQFDATLTQPTPLIGATSAGPESESTPESLVISPTNSDGISADAEPLADLSQAYEQWREEIGSVRALWLTEYHGVQTTRAEWEAAQYVQRAVAEGSAIHQAVVAQASHENNWATSLATAHRETARESAAAAHALAVGRAAANRQRADAEVFAQITYLSASRIAHWNHERAMADAKYERVLEQISEEEHAQRRESAARTKRGHEAAAFVVRALALADADVQHVQQLTSLGNDFSREIAGVSRAETGAQIDAEAALEQAKLTDWRLAADVLDHAAAAFDRNRLAAQLNWIIAATAANRRYENSIQQAHRTYEDAVHLQQARSDTAFPVIQFDSLDIPLTADATLTATASSVPVPQWNQGHNDSQWRRLIAEAEHTWNAAHWENLEHLLADRAVDDDQWLQAVTAAHLDGLAISRSGQIEYLNRLTDAVISRSSAQRSNEATWTMSRIDAEGQMTLQAVAAHGQFMQEVNSAEGEYAVSAASAERQWTISMAAAVGELHMSGDPTPVDADAVQSFTEAQRRYLEIKQQADQLRDDQLREAAIDRAERIGNGLIARAGQIGTAGRDLAEENGRAGLLFTQVSNALETSYAIAVSEAERRLVEAMTTATGRREVDLARAVQEWNVHSSQAHQRYLERSSLAAQSAAHALAGADIDYYLTSGDISLNSALNASGTSALEAVATEYAQHRSNRAAADGRLEMALSSAAAQLAIGYGAVDVTLAIGTSGARAEFARQSAGTVRQFHMSVVNADNLLLAQAAYHDQTRAREMAAAQAEFDIAAAEATKQLLVGMAQQSAGVDTTAVHRQWEMAVADEVARHARHQAEIDHHWTMQMVNAEEFHTRFVLAAAFSQERALVQHRQLLMSELADLTANGQSTEARLAAEWSNDIASARSRWQQEVAGVASEFRQIELQVMRTTFLDGAGESSLTAITSSQSAFDDFADGWIAHEETYRTWILERGTIETRYQHELGVAYRTYGDALAEADRQQAVDQISADSSRRLAELDAWETYFQYMVSPAKQLDLARADAERDLRVVQAEYHRGAILSGDSMASHSTLAIAMLDIQGRIEAAERNYQQAELVAASSRDNQLLALIGAHPTVVASHHATWNERQYAAYAQWNMAVHGRNSERSQAIQQEDENYLEHVRLIWNEHFLNDTSADFSGEFRTFLDLPVFRFRVHGHEIFHGEQHTSSMATISATLETASGTGHAFPADLRDTPSQMLAVIDDQPADVVVPPRARRLMASVSLGERFGTELSLDELHPSSYRAGMVSASDRWRNPSPAGEFSAAVPSSIATSPNFVSLNSTSLGTTTSISTTGSLTTLHDPLVVGESETSHDAFFQGFGDLIEWQLSDSLLVQGTMPSQQGGWGQADSGGYRSSTDTAATSSGHPASGWSTLLRDLSLMTRHPLATIHGAAGGFLTSGKVLVNGTLSTLKSTVSLGLATSPVEVLSVSETDRANGYETSLAIFRASQELLVGFGTGKLAAVKHAGQLGQIARGAYYWDAAQNATSMTRGAYGVTFGDGWNAENSINLAGGMLGLSGNVIGRTSPTRRAARELPPEVLEQPQVGFGVILESKRDKIGHAFVVFDWPNGARQAYGFYPRDGFSISNPSHIAELLGRNGGMAAEVIPEKLGMLQDFRTLLYQTPVSEARAEKAFALVYQIGDEAANGLVKYHAASQCATFTRRILREAGVRTFIPVPYPPLMYAKLWFMRTLG